MLIVAALGTAAGIGYAYEKVGDLPRADLGAALDPPNEDGPAEAVNVLLVGTDSSAGLDPDDPVNRGRNPASRLADVIMILRLEPDAGDAALLSIPRDLWVPIAGTDTSAKINRAYHVGGPETLIETIKDYLGIPVHHFAQVDFRGFHDVVAAIGGVEVYFPYPARDDGSRLDVPEAGCQVLDADQALAYARSRSYEELRDGQWRPDLQSDWGRMARQQEFIRLAMSRAIDRGARNPATLNALIDAATSDEAVLLDEDLTAGMILDIANAFRLFNPEDLGGYSLRDHVTDEYRGDEAAVVLDEASAGPLLDLFRGTADLEPSPETVRVVVLNGSGVRDQASDVAADLRLAGFVVRATDNADNEVDRTEVRYAPGQRASAELLARYLAGPSVLVEAIDPSEPPVTLVTGADYIGLLAEPRSSTSSTSSGVAPPPGDDPGPSEGTATTTPTTTPTSAAQDPGPDPDEDGPAPRDC